VILAYYTWCCVNLLLIFRTGSFTTNAWRRTDDRRWLSVAGHAICRHGSICILLGCGSCCCCCCGYRCSVLVDKSLALIETEDRWWSACQLFSDSRRPLVFLSRALLRVDRRRLARYVTATLHRRRIHVVASPSGRRFVPSFPEFMRRQTRPDGDCHRCLFAATCSSSFCRRLLPRVDMLKTSLPKVIWEEGRVAAL